MNHLLLLVGFATVLSVGGSQTELVAHDTDPVLNAFFGKYCLRCHDAQKQGGDFRLDVLPRDFTELSTAQRWGEVLFRIHSGEMPPKDAVQPAPEELGQIADVLSQQIQAGQAARMARRGPVSHYRLSRDEYGFVTYDLLGVHFDARMPGALNEDPRWHGFDRIGSLLSLSPSHVERYFSAAETVLELAFPVTAPQSSVGRVEAGSGRWLLFPGQQRGHISAREPGLYRLKVRLSALPSFKGRMPRLSIWNHSLKQAAVGRDVVATEESPVTVEIEAILPRGNFSLINEAPGMLSDGHTVSHMPETIASTDELKSHKPTGYKLFDDDGRSIFPLLLVDSIEWEGPIQLESDQQKRAGLFPSSSSDRAEIQNSLARFLRRAWRRPITDREMSRYVAIVESELAAGDDFRTAYLAALAGALTSQNYYYLVEGSPGEQRARLNDWELASRLSFFLWSSMPDDELFAAAEKGTLHEPGVLRAQLQRMLSDPKAARLTDAFPQQWLQLHRVGAFPPDSELFPDYDKWLEQSMILETTGFFGEVFARNLSIREFLTADWTVMNSRLARHYQMPLLATPGFQRIELDPEAHRGGVLTQAAVLSLTSDGTRHRPVHRGVWVSEAVFGRTPPPPPPNVEPLEPTPGDKPKATIRDQLEAHATHATCASCHRKIDPLGFAFDNYDAIGRWRTEEVVSGGQGANPPVKAYGQLPDGRKYSGPEEFKRLLADDLDPFAEAFVEQLATYGLRRVMTIDEAADLKAIASASRAEGYRLRSVIENLVLSELFQKR